MTAGQVPALKGNEMFEEYDDGFEEPHRKPMTMIPELLIVLLPTIAITVFFGWIIAEFLMLIYGD